jgi:hypothetical protein
MLSLVAVEMCGGVRWMCRSTASIVVVISARLIVIHVIVDVSPAASRLGISPLLLLLISFLLFLLLLFSSVENRPLVTLSLLSNVLQLSLLSGLVRRNRGLQIVLAVLDRP